jgi:F-type H+-transporting ATPase subunit delta
MAGEPDVTGTVFEEDSSQASRPYAEALINAASNEGQVDAILGELDELIADVWDREPRFRALLASPSTRPDDRDRLLVQVFEGRAMPTVVRFLRVLNRHGRLGLLRSVVREARALWDRRQNRLPVTVRSAATLDEGQQEALKERLRQMIHATPVVRLVVDPSLIGGLVVQVGDELYDGSVKTQLEKLRRGLFEKRTHEIQAKRDSLFSAS